MPWSNPTVDDVQGWLREAFDNVSDASCSSERRLYRAEDAANFAGLLIASWANSERVTNASDSALKSIFWRSKSLLENLLDPDRLNGRWNEEAHDVEAAQKLGSVLTMVMGYNLISFSSRPAMIRGLRQAALAAARFSASAGACALLEAPLDHGRGTHAAFETAQLASQLFRSADHHERFLKRLH